ncbi:DUF742 domain-containing protein [Streptomyces sp. L7]
MRTTPRSRTRCVGQLPEHQRICNLCREIKSVAEISALLTIPLGVARILVADLAEAGLVAIHQPGGDENAGGQPDVTLLERCSVDREALRRSFPLHHLGEDRGGGWLRRAARPRSSGPSRRSSPLPVRRPLHDRRLRRGHRRPHGHTGARRPPRSPWTTDASPWTRT